MTDVYVHDERRRRSLSDVMEFDRVIRVGYDGNVGYEPGIRAPELHDGKLEGDGTHPSDSARYNRWELMHGYSGQHGYSGPMMHSSEQIDGGLADAILDCPGLYVALVNYHTDDTEPDSWAVAFICTD